MTDDTTPQSTFPLNRRTILKGMGASAIGIAAFSGSAAASTDCESAGGTCACFGKIDGVPELGKTYTLTNGDVSVGVMFDDYMKKDDGEVYAVHWKVTDRTYPVCQTITKGGPYARVRTTFKGDPANGDEAAYGGWAETFTNPKNGKRYGLSNLQVYFCVPGDETDGLDQIDCKHSDKWTENGDEDEEPNGPPEQARGRGR